MNKLFICQGVKILSTESNELLVFLDETVLADYDKFASLANQYKEDANYYEETSGSMEHNAEEVMDAIQSISNVLENASSAQMELASAVESVNALQETMENLICKAIYTFLEFPVNKERLCFVGAPA